MEFVIQNNTNCPVKSSNVLNKETFFVSRISILDYIKAPTSQNPDRNTFQSRIFVIQINSYSSCVLNFCVCLGKVCPLCQYRPSSHFFIIQLTLGHIVYYTIPYYTLNLNEKEDHSMRPDAVLSLE